MTILTYDDCEEKIIELRQQLASREAEVANLAALGSSYLNRANAAEQEVDSLCQQLADHIKREMMLRETLSSYDGSHSIDQWDENLMPSRAWDERRIEALAATKPKEHEK